MFRSMMLVTSLICLAAPSQASTQWRVLPEPIQDLRAYAGERAADRELLSDGAAVPAPEGRKGLVKGFDLPSEGLLLPSFEVDTRNGGGLTTLISTRNVGSGPQLTKAFYFDSKLNLLAVRETVLDPNEVWPVNLRDIGELAASADGQGIARGSVLVVADSESQVLAGDYFKADPANNFATGDRMLTDQSQLCVHWGIRFLNGGAFSGGTTYSLYLTSPLGGSMEEGTDPTVMVNAYDESGALFNTYGIWTDSHLLELTASDLVGQGLAAGSFEFLIDDRAEDTGGHLSGRFSASGKFSVGLEGLCLTPPVN